jgi:FkbM family methyltransferase
MLIQKHSAAKRTFRAIPNVRIGKCGPIARRLARTLRWTLPAGIIDSGTERDSLTRAYCSSFSIRCLTRVLGEPKSTTKPVRATTELDGVVFDLDLREGLHRLVYLDIFEFGLRRLVLPLLRPGDLVVDVGANFGFWALAAANKGCSVIAIEPISPTRDLLVANATRNGLEHQLEVVSDAVSDAIGELAMMIPVGETGHASAHPEPAANYERFTVATTTLDDLIGDRHVRLLKVDVEGHEVHVLSGAKRILSQGSVDYVMIEIVDEHLQRAGSSAASLCQLLTDSGFDLVRWIPVNDGQFPHRRGRLPLISEIGDRPGDALWKWRGTSTATPAAQ